MTKLGDAIDAVTFNLRRPERLRVALVALASVDVPTGELALDVDACDALLRKVNRGLTMLDHEEFSRFTRAVCDDARAELDAAIHGSLRALRAHEAALLRWRDEALAHEGSDARDSGSYAKADGVAVTDSWVGLFASER